MWGAIVSLLSAWAVTVAPVGTTCPRADAVAAELERLGATLALAALGSPEITVKDAQMQVVLRGPDGSLLGTREVAAPDDCDQRATVAAVFIAAWVGIWTTAPLAEGPQAEIPNPAPTGFPPATARPRRAVPALSPGLALREQGEVAKADVAKPSDNNAAATDTKKVASSETKTAAPTAAKAAAPPATAKPSPAAPAAAPVAVAVKPKRNSRGEVAGLGFGTYDGDAGTLGGGILVGYQPAGALALAALFEATRERERTLGPGSVDYRTFRLGVGVGGLRRWGRVFGDIGIFPELTLLTVDSKQLATGRSATVWGAAADLRGRFGITWGRFAPFLFAGASYALRGEQLTLEDRPQTAALSRWNVSLGAGLAFLFGAR